MNPKDLARMLPNLLGAAVTLITVILLVVGLATEPGEGSSGSSSQQGSSSSRGNGQSEIETSSAPQDNHFSSAPGTPSPKNQATPTPDSTTTPTQRKGVSAPTRALPPRQQPTTATSSATQPTSTPQFTKPAPVPTPKEEDPALNDPEVPATATLGYDTDGNRTATWIEDGFRYTKTYTDDGTTLNKTNEGLRTKTVTTSKDGITYYTEYDEQDNPLTTRSSGVYTPPRDPFENFTPPPLPPREPSSRTDPAVEKQYTPRELETEIRRQFDEWNIYRIENGLPTGKWDQNLANGAQKWANKLAAADNGTGRIYDSHPHERDYAANVYDPSYNFIDLNAGENVWMTDAQDLERACKVFAKSPLHNRNLLLSGKKNKPIRMGVGIAKGTGLDQNGEIPYYVVYKMGY